jgi:DNA invertase Pin-like site-specific DNA recombinase
MDTTFISGSLVSRSECRRLKYTRWERQLEGIAKAKAAGVYKGRVASIDADQVRKLKANGVGASEIAKALKIGRASIYRVLGAAPQLLSEEA